MSVLPRTIPAAVLTALTDAAASSGFEVGPLKPGTRVTHTIDLGGTTWDVTYLGPMGDEPVWRLAGPGIEHGIGVTAAELVAHLTAPAPEPEPAPQTNTYVPTAAVSAALKRELSAVFPGVAFRVRKGAGTGSAWLSVTWTDGPSTADVDRVCGPFHGARWDGWSETYHQTRNVITATYKGETITGKPVVDGITTHHEVSDDARAEAAELWSQAHDGAQPEDAGQCDSFVVGDRIIRDNWAPNQVLQIAREVVLPRRWAAAREAAILEAAATAATATAPAEPAPTAEGNEAGEGLTVTHSETEGVAVHGTRRGDGSAPILKAAGFRWYRRGGFWYLPGTRTTAASARLAPVVEQLRAAGLPLAAPAAEAPAPAPAPQPDQADEVPEAAPAQPVIYRGVPVPAALVDGPQYLAWCAGVDAALLHLAPAA